jgi:hypothetical protein
VSLRANPVEGTATLPDGRRVTIRIGVPDDSYIPGKELQMVSIELSADGEHLGAVSSLLDADQDSAARQLLHEIVVGLESGAIPPTAGGIEPLADRLRR